MKINMIQDILSHECPRFHEEIKLSIDVAKNDLLKLINNAGDNEEVTFRRQPAYIDDLRNCEEK